MSQDCESKRDLNISELTNEELKSKIMKLNNDQLLNIRDMSYYYLLSQTGKTIRLMEDKNIFEKMDFIKEKDDLIRNFNIIINSFKKFQTDIIESEVEEEIKKLLDTREKLYDLAMGVYAYEIEISYVKELIDHTTMKRISKIEYKDRVVDETNVHLLINRIRNILDKTEEDDVFIAIVSNILGILPFRMSKNKYFDVVKSTLVRNFNNYPINVVKGQIEEYKILFDSRLRGDYGILFDNYFTSIQRFRNTNIASKSIDELEKMAKEVIQLIEEISKLSVFINNMGVLTNRLIVLYLTKDNIDINLKIKDSFDRWEEFLKTRDTKLLDDLIKICNIELENLEDELLNKINILEEINQEAVKRQELDDKTFNGKILFTGKVLTYYNDIEFTRLDLLFSDKYEIVDKNYLVQLVDNLIQYMNRSISSMNNVERKVRMRRFLSLLQLPFEDMEEFFTYVEYSFDETAIGIEEILFIIDAINYLLDEYKERQ